MVTYSHVGGGFETLEDDSCGMGEGMIGLESIDKLDLAK